jgi:hypothetical protein
MGSLGRGRCFIVNEETPQLKLPSDLLGMKLATFQRSGDRNLANSLDAHCLAISDRIKKLGTRYRLATDVVAAQEGVRQFCESIEGAWWERITNGDVVALTFFRIEDDAVFNSVTLNGRSYNQEGHHMAYWKSLLTRVDTEKHRILYHWEGWYTLPDRANLMFSGFGEMEFDKRLSAAALVIRGGGKFWDVNESHPEKTSVQATELRRVSEPRAISVMTDGKEKAVRSLIKKTLLAW